MFRTIRWKLLISSLLAVSIPLVILGVVLANLLWQFYLGQLERELRAKAFIIADAAAPVLKPDTPDNPAALSNMVEKWRAFSNVRVTITDAKGIIRAAYDAADVGAIVREERRPGLQLALSGTENSTVWKNPQFGNQDTMYANVPVRENGSILGAVRVAYTLTEIQRNVARIRFTLQASLALYAALIIFLTVELARAISRPIEEVTRSAQRLAAGDLDHRVPLDGTEEIQQLASTLNQMTARLQQLEGLRRQYVSNVSHELRTPLAAIRGMAETLMAHGESDPELRARYLPRIVTQTERLARLASQVLDLAQIESGNLVTLVESVSLETVIDEVVHTTARTAEEKDVRVVVDLAPSLPPLPADRDRLVQVFLNLVDNAIRHTPSGGRVTVTAWTEGSSLIARVSDTGEGIPDAHLPYLFERFYRVEQARTRRSGGAGLGLSIVRQIVEIHGGEIQVDSTVGEGTTFEVKLPLFPESPAPVEARGQEAPA